VDRNLEFFLTSHIDFLFIFGQSGDNCKHDPFLQRKVGVTERPRSSNPGKALKTTICPIIIHSGASAREAHQLSTMGKKN